MPTIFEGKIRSYRKTNKIYKILKEHITVWFGLTMFSDFGRFSNHKGE